MAYPEQPLQWTYGGEVDDFHGYLCLSFGGEASFMEAHHSFWSSKFIEQRFQFAFQVNLLRSQIPVAFGFLSHTAPEAHFVPFEKMGGKGLMTETGKFRFRRIPIVEVGQFEVVNAQQWEGRPPYDLKDGHGRVLSTEPPLWEVAALDHGTGARIVAMRCHNHKDQVFQFCNHLNTWLDWIRQIVEPFANEIDEVNPDDAATLWDACRGDNAKADLLWDSLWIPLWRELRETVPPVFNGNYTILERQDLEGGYEPVIITPLPDEE